MSHFSVLVAANDAEDLLVKMLPYYEYGANVELDEMVRPWLDFEDEEEEHRNMYQSEGVVLVRMPEGWSLSQRKTVPVREETTFLINGRWYLTRWDDEFRTASFPGSFGGSTHHVPDHLAQEEIPYTQMYSSFESYMENWCGYSERDQEKGRYGNWRNPNAKWDWYVVGGRWAGAVLSSGTATPNTPAGRRRSGRDVMSKGDVDFDALRRINRMDGVREWQRWENFLHEMGLTGPEWMALSEDAKAAAREEIRLTVFGAECYAHLRDDYYNFLFFQPAGLTLQEHAAARFHQALTFAYIDEFGEWNQRAQMGWWAITHDENDSYDEEFWSWIGSLPDDQVLYVVDCHI